MKKALARALTNESVSTDEQLLELWLHGKSANTQRTYRREAMWFLAFVEKSVFQVTLADVQAFATYLEKSSGLKPSTHIPQVS